MFAFCAFSATRATPRMAQDVSDSAREAFELNRETAGVLADEGDDASDGDVDDQDDDEEFDDPDADDECPIELPRVTPLPVMTVAMRFIWRVMHSANLVEKSLAEIQSESNSASLRSFLGHCLKNKSFLDLIVSTMFNIGVRQARRWRNALDTYVETGALYTAETTSADGHGVVAHLDSDTIAALLEYVSANAVVRGKPNLKLRHFCDWLHAEYLYRVSESTMSRILARHGFVFGKMRPMMLRDGHDREDVVKYRQEVFVPRILEMRNNPAYVFVFFDESWVNVDHCEKWGWHLRGQTTADQPTGKGKRVCLQGFLIDSVWEWRLDADGVCVAVRVWNAVVCDNSRVWRSNCTSTSSLSLIFSSTKRECFLVADLSPQRATNMTPLRWQLLSSRL